MSVLNSEVTISEVITRNNGGGFYQIEGDLVNGGLVAEVMFGIVSPRLYEITRRINFISLERKRLYCECGRKFHINESLKLIKCNY